MARAEVGPGPVLAQEPFRIRERRLDQRVNLAGLRGRRLQVDLRGVALRRGHAVDGLFKTTEGRIVEALHAPEEKPNREEGYQGEGRFRPDEWHFGRDIRIWRFFQH